MIAGPSPAWGTERLTVIAEAGAARSFAEPVQIGFGLSSGRDMVDLARTLPDWEHNEMPIREYVSGNNVKLSIRAHEPIGVVLALICLALIAKAALAVLIG